MGKGTVVVSRGFRIVIPSHIRKSLGIKPGQQLRVLPFEGRLELPPILPAKSLRGYLKGIARSVRRDRDRVKELRAFHNQLSLLPR
jgi:AbrB family looped-hinge helix DNA binding protein